MIVCSLEKLEFFSLISISSEYVIETVHTTAHFLSFHTLPYIRFGEFGVDVLDNSGEHLSFSRNRRIIIQMPTTTNTIVTSTTTTTAAIPIARVEETIQFIDHIAGP